MLVHRVFWNPDVRRVRAVWRLLAQFTLRLVLLICAGAAASWLIEHAADDEGVRDVLGSVARTIVEPLAAFVSVALVGRSLDGRGLRSFGLRIDREWLADCAFGLILGALLVAGVFTTLLAAGWIELRSASDANPSLLPIALVLVLSAFRCVSNGFEEELGDRAYLLRNAMEGLRSRIVGHRAAALVALVLVSLFFGLGHSRGEYASWLSTLNLAFLGVLLGISYLTTGQLGIAIGIHTTWNFFQGSVFGFAVSGEPPAASLIGVAPTGSPLVTGGAFGVEASVLCLPAIAIGIVLTLAWVRWRRRGLSIVVPSVGP